MDISVITDQFGLLLLAVAAVGAAKLAPAAASVSWKWLKGAVFG